MLLERLKERSLALARSGWPESMLYRGDDARRLAKLSDIAARARVPLIAVNDVLYHVPERRELQDVVTCIREKTTIDKAGKLLEANAERHLKDACRNGAAVPQVLPMRLRRPAISSANAISRSKNCAAPNIRKKPARATRRRRRPWWRLRKPARRSAFRTACRQKIRHALDRGTAIVGELGYAPFFLTVHDIVQFRARARREHPLPGPRLGGEFADLLLPRNHRSEPRARRSPVRALRVGGAARAARHRRRFRARAARGGHSIYLPDVHAASGQGSPRP